MKRKKQIAKPKEHRADPLLVAERERAIVLAKPTTIGKAIRGIGKGLYPPGYLDKERNSWDDLE